MGKEVSFQQMVLGSPDIHMQNNKVEHHLTPHATINSKWIADLHVRLKITKPLEENLRVNLLTLG